MTMVPAPKLSKPHLVFYRGCGGGAGGGGAAGGAFDVMSRFGDGCSGGGGGYAGYNNNINGNADNIISNNNTRVASPVNNNGAHVNKVDDNTNGSCVLGSDLGVGRHPNLNNTTDYSYHNIVAMGEEEHSRTSNTSVNDDGGDQQPAAAHPAPTSSTSIKRRDDDTPTPPPPLQHQDHHHHHRANSSSWLQLGLGGTHQRSTPPEQHAHHQHQQQHPYRAQMGGGSSGLMLELNLGGGGGSGGGRIGMIPQTTSMVMMPELDGRIQHRPLDYTSTNLFGVGSGGGGSNTGGSSLGGLGMPTTFVTPHHPIIPLMPSQQFQPYLHHPHHQLLSLNDHHQLQQQQQQQHMGWGYASQRTTLSSSPSSSSSIPVQGGAGSFLTRPFTTPGSSVDAADSEFRIIHPPPRRPHSGIWFSLQASIHQLKELSLPQVPKSFLRIKDGRMTVRLVMKYVANKLGLDSESEVEIRCRGQQLLPYLTLQHVRDNIWSPREAVSVTLLPDSSTSDHVMVLNYGRSTISSAYLPTSALPN